MIDRKNIDNALAACLEDKGKRKFTQSVEYIVNYKNIDFSKQDKRLNLEVLLPHGTGKAMKVALFADGQFAFDAKNAGIELIIPGAEIPELAKDKGRLKVLMKDHAFLSAPQLMTQVGKFLGQAMGTKDKLPKPAAGDLKAMAERARRTVKIRSKGRYLPVTQCRVGTENMPPDQLAENIMAVYDTLATKVGEHSIKSSYVKLTMGKAREVGAKAAKAAA